MDELLETVTTAESSHEGCRVWITTEVHNQFPISLLQVRSVKTSLIFSSQLSKILEQICMVAFCFCLFAGTTVKPVVSRSLERT